MSTLLHHRKGMTSLHHLQILMNASVTPVNATTIVITLMDGISVLAKMALCLALTNTTVQVSSAHLCPTTDIYVLNVAAFDFRQHYNPTLILYSAILNSLVPDYGTLLIEYQLLLMRGD